MTTFIEKDCTIEHEGKKFESGGAYCDDKWLIAYPSKDGALQDWHGNNIGTYSVISSREAIFFGYRSHWANRYYYMRAHLNDGRTYSIRGFGEGMVAKGKRVK